MKKLLLAAIVAVPLFIATIAAYTWFTIPPTPDPDGLPASADDASTSWPNAKV